ncbi:hypothetical protein [Aquabacterium sp. OR-4]|uniref:hypothetical protein n=1 Tax=Aquabacterium sp. OR-4 TaxID=2978127 RepID=UPI0021B41C96|nr:hypothetical protein [Aquabacterium sp. OR-4]MDT7838185.1 hypothetical protein [Aquabacterium sp. OR-4]
MKRLALSAVALAAICGLSGCASIHPAASPLAPQAAAGTPLMQRLQAGAQLLGQGEARAAREVFADAAAQDVTDPRRQTLLGLAYHAEAGGGPDGVRMARVGYEAALRAAPHDFWAGALAGRAAFDLGDYQGASNHFGRLVLHHPHRAEALAALAVAAYHAGDPGLALLAAQRAEVLVRDAPADSAGPPPSPGLNATPGASLPPAALTLATALRVSALAHAALGEQAAAEGTLQRLAVADSKGAEAVRGRTRQLLRTAPIDDAKSPAADSREDDEDAPRARSSAGENRQVTVDVAILLAQYKRSDRVGLNLLDGLRLQYSATRTSNGTRSDSGSSDFVRTITRAISLPDLSYNLNLFNRQGDYYEVAARPTLSALLNEPSEFFVGRSLSVEVSGINSGELKDIDVGVRLKALPLEIDESGAKIQITAERSFLQDASAGTFKQSISTFRQSVSATARVEFGQTLLLSGLSETVSNTTSSSTPLLGDAPVLGLAFNQRSTDQRRDAVLILVTPSRTTSFQSASWVRSDKLQQLIALWEKVVDPATNAGSVVQRLSQMRLFSRMQAGDVGLAWPAPQQQPQQFAGAILGAEQP